jgi:trans-aconitate methyltransferase
MADPTHDDSYDGTIDWDDHWRDADETIRDRDSPSAQHGAKALGDFAAKRRTPDAVADVGCGPGVATLYLADRFPESTVVGYDAAPAVLDDARDRAREKGVENVRFEQATLPAFDPDREFDIVFSYFTLCYVADVERALQALYNAVAPGGALVCNYVNSLALPHFRRVAEAPHEHAEFPFVFDPDQFTERFDALLAGESVLSYDRIHETLGTWPQSVWSVVDRPEKRWAWRHMPLVYVPK